MYFSDGFTQDAISNDYFGENRKMFKGRGEKWEKLLEPNCPCYPSMTKRYTVSFLSSIGFLISFGIRCNMGVAIVQMVSNETGQVSQWFEIHNTNLKLIHEHKLLALIIIKFD